MQRPPRVVIDTSIFVSGLINPHGQPARVLFAQEHGQIHLLTAPALMSEVGQVLRRPHIQARHRLSDTRLSAFLLRVLTSSEVVTPLTDLPLTSRDPKDDMFLAVALGGAAEYLVNRDMAYARAFEARAYGIRPYIATGRPHFNRTGPRIGAPHLTPRRPLPPRRPRPRPCPALRVRRARSGW